jgi:hypothetical protein
MPKRFYKARYVEDECGMAIRMSTLESIHETPCMHFCILVNQVRQLDVFVKQGESKIKWLRKQKGLQWKLFRVHKDGSRIAFETEEKAIEHLIFLKRKQIQHLKRNLDLVQTFLNKVDEINSNGSVVDLLSDRFGCRRLPDTEDKVREYFVFN